MSYLSCETYFDPLSLPGVQIKPEAKPTLPKLPAAPGSTGKQQTPKVSGGEEPEEVKLDGPQQLSSKTLCLPICRISESVQQLMELALSTLREAVGSSTQW